MPYGSTTYYYPGGSNSWNYGDSSFVTTPSKKVDPAILKQLRVGSMVTYSYGEKGIMNGWNKCNKEIYIENKGAVPFNEIEEVCNEDIPSSYPRVYLQKFYEVRNIKECPFGYNSDMRGMNGIPLEIRSCNYQSDRNIFRLTVLYNGYHFSLGVENLLKGDRIKMLGI